MQYGKGESMHNLWPLIILPLFIAACGDKDNDTAEDTSADTSEEVEASEEATEETE